MARPIYDYNTGEWYEGEDDPAAPQPNYGGGDLYYGAPAPTLAGPLPEEQPAPTPESPEQPPPPAPPAPDGSGGDSGGSSDYETPGTFEISSSWPTFTAPPRPTLPTFQQPTPYDYREFSYDPFTAPTLEQAQNEPGYDFARREGMRALENSASARGVLRTGGTIKDFIGWGNKFAEQNYGNVYNRAANTYSLNRGNAFQTHQANELGRLGEWNTNFGASKDVFDRNTQNILDAYDLEHQAALAEFNPRFRAAELTFGDIYNRDRDLLDALTQLGVIGATS